MVDSLAVAQASVDKIVEQGGVSIMNAHFDSIAKPYSILATEQISGGVSGVSSLLVMWL